MLAFRRAPTAPFRAARAFPTSLASPPGRARSPGQCPAASAAPAPGCLSPGAGILGRGRRGAATVNKGAEPRLPATCRPSSSLQGESLEQSLGQYSFRLSFYQHKGRVVLKTRSWALLHLCPSVGFVRLRPSLPAPGDCVLFSLYSSRSSIADPREIITFG